MDSKVVLIICSLVGICIGFPDECPFPKFPSECDCIKGAVTHIACPGETVLSTPWNIRRTFEAIADSINDKDFVVDQLYLRGRNLEQAQDIPAHAISRTKFNHVHITNDGKFGRIDLNAFTGTYDTTTYFNYCCQNQDRVQLDFFALLNRFNKLTSISISTTTIERIPGFRHHKNLQFLWLDRNNISYVANNAFSGLNDLNAIYMTYNHLSDDSFQDNTLAGVGSSTRLEIQMNPRIKTLAESKFKAFLDLGKTSIVVGVNIPVVNPEDYFLRCDHSADWICANAQSYIGRIYGYKCWNSQYMDVFEYCEKTFAK